MQQPAPPLSCVTIRRPFQIEAAAPPATPTLDRRILPPKEPKTEVWILLYAQVRQLDGASWRNVLLRRARAVLPFDNLDRQYAERLTDHATATFDMDTTWTRLNELGLPRATPMSVMAVETLPVLGAVRYPDPLGAHIGMVCILRTSPLVAVPPVCV